MLDKKISKHQKNKNKVDMKEVALHDYLSNEQAAAFIGISPQTLARWRIYDEDSPAFIKIGGRILYSKQTLRDWLDDHIISYEETENEN